MHSIKVDCQYLVPFLLKTRSNLINLFDIVCICLDIII
jgi:hypothetical protein